MIPAPLTTKLCLFWGPEYNLEMKNQHYFKIQSIMVIMHEFQLQRRVPC